MRTQSNDIEYAKALARADKERHAAIDTAAEQLRAAGSPEAEAEAAQHLIGVAEQAEIDFRDYMGRISDRLAHGDREMELVRRAFGANPQESVA